MLRKVLLELRHCLERDITTSMMAAKIGLQQSLRCRFVQLQASIASELLHYICKIQKETGREAVIVLFGPEMQSSEVLHPQHFDQW